MIFRTFIFFTSSRTRTYKLYNLRLFELTLHLTRTRFRWLRVSSPSHSASPISTYFL